MSTPRIAFLGGGNMAEALIRGLQKSSTPPAEILATVRRPERAEELKSRYNITATASNAEAAQRADLLVLSVKPQALESLLHQIGNAVSRRHLVVSIAAGVPIAALERRLPKDTRIIRAMPNTPALIGRGATALSAGPYADRKDVEQARALFDAVGITVEVDESLLDAVTGLSGSGPAYIFMILEALTDAGVKVGLSRHIALKLATQTLLGSAQMLQETGLHPGHLKDQVTSPGGTAIAGLHTLESGGLRTTLMDAVEAATKRARELGAQFLEPRS